LYGCEIEYLTSREEHTLVLRTDNAKENILNLRQEVTGGWRKLHSEDLHYSCSSKKMIKLIKSKRKSWSAREECMGEVRNAYDILVRRDEITSENKHRWQDNIKMDVTETSAMNGGEWSASRPGRFALGKEPLEPTE
jgi:tRNA U34 5-carboxymethylaminomethyl modifying enzyme MnmG/GidA